MPNKLPIYSDFSNTFKPINYISFWEKGEMAFTALQKINELKANNEWENAEIMLTEWIL